MRSEKPFVLHNCCLCMLIFVCN